MERVRSVFYHKRHEQLVESGIEKLSMALDNETEEEKASILFEHNSVEIKEDILDLLELYGKQPLNILWENLDKLSGELLYHAKHILFDEE